MNRIEAQLALMDGKKVRGVKWADGTYIYRDEHGNIFSQKNIHCLEQDNPFSGCYLTDAFEIYEEKQAVGFVDYPVTVKSGRYSYSHHFIHAAISYESFIGYVYMVNGKERAYNSCIIYMTDGDSVYNYQIPGSKAVRPIAVRFRKDKDD